MATFRTTILQSGKEATGIRIPAAIGKPRPKSIEMLREGRAR